MSEPGFVKSFKADSLTVRVYKSAEDLAAAAAETAGDHLRRTLDSQGTATIILATGNSQIIFLKQLAKCGGVDWSKATLFHMDEYLGLPAGHPASFRRYLQERVQSKLGPRTFHYLDGDALEPIKECDRYAGLLRGHPVDLCCLGIGENGHLAFNDPSVANFGDDRLVKIVKLDEVCKQQQVGEGHFQNYESVPSHALTLTIPALCAAKQMICVVPEKRKARAVKAALKGSIATTCPASFLRTQTQAILFLDVESASLL